MSAIARISAGGNKFTTYCQGGGDKKAGLVPTATGFYLSQPFAWRAALGGIATPGNGRGRGNLTKNFPISTVNQIGGVGKYRSQTTHPSRGINMNAIKQSSANCKLSVSNPNINFNTNIVVVPNLVGATNKVMPF
tara:strand:- start:933 stop:1337 length:405 start_codon:yes stop_codon:yes gene_type:complete